MTTLPPPTTRTTDEEPRRATYGVRYPRGAGEILTFETKMDVLTKVSEPAPGHTKRRVAAKRVTITVRLRDFEGITFVECNFHDKQGQGAATLDQVTFRDCEFKRTFFGTTEFSQVRFIDCTFEQCDFSNDHFRDCLFERCTFSRCSARNALFYRTEVDPRAFLAGTAFPAYNLTDKTEDLRRTVRREWLHVRLRLAEQLFRSNSEILHSQFSDAGLFELKMAQHASRQDLWRHGTSAYDAKPLPFWRALRNDPSGPLRAAWRRVMLSLTDGGTSVRKLAGVIGILALVYPLLLSQVAISYGGARCVLVSDDGSFLFNYFRLVLLSASLLLGFGFTAFSSTGVLATLVQVAASTFGVVWYALLIPVLIRKVYR